MSLIEELKRRNVIRLLLAYAVVSWLVIEVSNTLLEIFGAPDWVAKAIIVVLVIGMVVTGIFSWVYELTPEGLKKESEVARDASITHQTGKKLNYITIAAVVVVAAFVGWSRFVAAPPESAVETEIAVPGIADGASVAVLPFVNMSDSKETEYFSDGLTETLLHMLVQLPELKVAARTSSFAFKGKDKDIREIAQALDVAHVLEGSVQRSGDRVRITAQLIRADDGFHVWSENFDRTLDDIFAIQDEIAQKVGGALSASLLGSALVDIDGVGTTDVAAYDLYLQALSRMAVGSYDALEAAEGLLKDALNEDPEFLDAKTDLGTVYLRQANTGLMQWEEAIRASNALAQQVIAVRPQDSRAKTMQLQADMESARHFGNRAELRAVFDRFEKLIAQQPNLVEAKTEYAQAIGFAGDIDTAQRHFADALELDPLNPRIYLNMGFALETQDKNDEAREALLRSLELEPGQPNAWAKLGDVSYNEGDIVGYVKGYTEAMRLDSKDHEIPAEVARTLYDYSLVEAGDKFLSRANLVAATGDMTRVAAMWRAVAIADAELAESIAKQLLLDDVSWRHGMFWQATLTLKSVSRQEDREQDAIDFFSDHFDGYTDVGSLDVSNKVQFLQDVSLPLWHETVPESEFEAMAAAIERSLEVRAQTDDDNEYTYVDLYALQGKEADAAQHMLAILKDGNGARWPGFDRYAKQKHLATIVRDDAIQTELQRMQEERQEAREALRRYLADLDL